MTQQTPPPGYSPAGTVTVTIRFADGPLSVTGPVLRHEPCGELVTAAGTAQHKRLGCPEAVEAA